MAVNLSIIGSGGHAAEVFDCLNYRKNDFVISVFDEINHGPKLAFGLYEVQILNDYNKLNGMFHAAVGSNEARSRISMAAKKLNKKALKVVHRSSLVGFGAEIGDGVFIAANSIIATNSKIKSGCIINHGAIVDHDCYVDEYSHVAPNSTIGGGVTIGKQCLVGAGSVILPNVRVGDFCVIGAGSVIIKDIPSGVKVAGNPAREI